jgi:hypothetical protein
MQLRVPYSKLSWSSQLTSALDEEAISPEHRFYIVPLRLRFLFRHRQVEQELDKRSRENFLPGRRHSPLDILGKSGILPLNLLGGVL